jgi:PAS domain S-box-containing protein
VTTNSSNTTRRSGIRRMLVLLLLIVLVPVLAVQGGMYYREFRNETADELRANLEVARAVAVAFQAYIDDLRREELAVGHAFVLLEPFSASQGSAYLAENARRYPNMHSLSWVDPRGRIVASSWPREIGQNVAATSWFVRILDGDSWVVTDLARSRVPGEASLTVASGIREADGSLKGIVAAALHPESLSLNLRRTRGGAYSIIDSSGWLVYRDPQIDMPWEQRDWGKLYAVVRRALNGKEGSELVYALYEDQNRLAAATPIRSIGWVAGAGRRESEVFAPIRSDMYRNMAALVGVALLALVGATVAAGTITAPVRRLRNRALAVGRGEPAQALELSGPAELADLAAAFNRMAADIAIREREQRRLVRELETERALLRAMLQQMPSGVVVVDADGHSIVTNDAAVRITRGANASEDVQTQEMHPDEALYLHEDSPLTHALRSGEVTSRKEIRLVRPDGSEAVIEASAAPIRDAEGRIIAAISVFQDITERKHQQDELARAHERLQLLMDALPVGVATALDPECRVITTNPVAAETFEADVGANVSMSASEEERPAHRFFQNGRELAPEQMPLQKAVLANQRIHDEELEMLSASGRRRVLRISAAPVHDRAGNVVGGIAVTWDVTELRQAQQAIVDARAEAERQARLLEAIAENSRGQLVYLDREFNFVWVNKAYAEACRRREEEFVGHNHFEFYPDEDNEAIFKRVRDTGVAAEYREKPFVFPDMPERGVTYWDWTLTPVKGDGGEVAGLVFSLVDMTEQVKTRQRIAETERLLATIIENTDTLLAYLDRDLRFIRVNPAYGRACGRADEDLVGRSHLEVWGDPERVVMMEQARDTGEPVRRLEYSFGVPAQPERGVVYWDWVVVPIRTEQGHVDALVTSATDVTEKVLARERVTAAERARAEAAETVAAEINHRMKNNLMLVSGILQLQLSSQPPDSPAMAALSQAISRISALSVVHEQLIEDRSGRVELQYALRRIGEMVIGALSSGDVELHVTGCQVPVHSRIGSAISIIANELITNAVKHGLTPGGKPRVEIDIGLDAGRLRLRIWNSGNPIPEGFNIAEQRGMGLRIAYEVATRQLRGSLDIRPHNGGTLTEMTVDETILDGRRPLS